MDKNNKLYFAYGSNLNLAQMAYRCPTAKVLGASVLKDWRLLFRGAHESAVATVEPAQGGSVPVLAWEITPSDEASLDRYEGWRFLYRKEEVAATLDGETVSAMMYVMNEGRLLGQPSDKYYSTILAGYRNAGFDENVLHQATVESAEMDEDTCE